MELKDFIGKVVLSSDSKERYFIEEISAVYIQVVSEKLNSIGYPSHYQYKTGTLKNDNAIATGKLIFEDSSLTKPFIDMYEKYTSSEAGRTDAWLYWMQVAD